ncbi:SBBP repeat-containing protein [Cytophagaceae bacterium YF14B1]|uniref:SBBP repeat-containing protein n=1 Tax=Xanthocytophaga flava TaxID=3048013 RepID=A0AAE3QUK1_9BACT|nr:SBBP repeat-containing protein [Xanthocytophaga flavus]MDJ1483755.1 SBBP repeat-containing protein [Xanthocytophaga flavus]
MIQYLHICFKRSHCILSIVAILFFQSLVGSGQDFIWTKQAGGTGDDLGIEIAVDDLGNSYVTGQIQGSTMFGTTNLVSAGGNDIFIAKYDPSGNVLWAIRAGGTSNDDVRGMNIDKNGNCVITGSFRGSAKFGTTTITAYNDSWSDMFLAKIDPNGNFLWAKNAATDPENQGGYGLEIDKDGSIYVSGVFTASASFSSIKLISQGGSDIFLAKFDATGNIIWVKGAGGNGGVGYELGRDVALDVNGNCYLTGGFQNTAKFGTSITLTSAGGTNDIFLAKYDSNGNVLWAKRAGGNGGDIGQSLTTDISGNVFLTGRFSNTSNFGGINLTSLGSFDGFIAKYTPDGSVTWAQKVGSPNADFGQGIVVDAGGNCFIAGQYSGNTILNCATISNKGQGDMYVAKYDPDGNILWAQNAGGTADDAGYSLGIDKTGNCYITGSFASSPATFGESSFTNKGNQDIFVAKLFSVPNSITLSDANPVCPYTSFSVSFAISCAASSQTYSVQLSEPNSSNFPVTPQIIGTGTSSPITVTLPTGLQPGNYFIRVVSSNGTISNIVPLQVQVAASSVAIQASDLGPCGSTSIDFSLTTTNTGSSPTYSWSVKIDDVIQSATSTSDKLSFALPQTTEGYTLEVSVIMKSSNACTVPVTDTWKMYIDKFPSLVLNSLNPVCQQGTLSLAFSTSCSPNSGVAYTAQLSPVGTNSFQDIATGSGSPISGIQLNNLSPGLYKVRIKSSTGLQSNEVDLVILSVDKADVALQEKRVNTCTDETVTVKTTAPQTGALFQWQLNGNNTGETTSADSLVLPSFADINKDTTLLVSVYVTFPNSCIQSDTAQLVVTYYPALTITCSIPDTIDIDVPTPFITSTSKGKPPYKINWSLDPTGKLLFVRSDTAMLSFQEEGISFVSATVKDERGCEVTCSKYVYINAPIGTIPNVFTPNYDEFNKRFTINYKGKRKFKMEIYNRWGRLITTVHDGVYGWDGGNCTSGIYYYQIQVGEQSFKGWVHLLRDAEQNP